MEATAWVMKKQLQKIKGFRESAQSGQTLEIPLFYKLFQPFVIWCVTEELRSPHWNALDFFSQSYFSIMREIPGYMTPAGYYIQSCRRPPIKEKSRAHSWRWTLSREIYRFAVSTSLCPRTCEIVERGTPSMTSSLPNLRLREWKPFPSKAECSIPAAFW